MATSYNLPQGSTQLLGAANQLAYLFSQWNAMTFVLLLALQSATFTVAVNAPPPAFAGSG